MKSQRISKSAALIAAFSTIMAVTASQAANEWAVDAKGNHEVVNFRCEGEIRYWLWEESMPEPELRAAKLA